MFLANDSDSISRTRRWTINSVIVCGVALFNLGCGSGPPAEFKYREATLNLIPNAKKAAENTMKESFGTPNDLVAWERFPIAYGGLKGTVAATEGKAVTVTIEGDAPKLKKDASVLWLTGSLVDEKASGKVASFDPKTKQLQLAGSAKPAVGDKFVIGFGKDMQLGRHVYMKNCMHCHGVTGDGNGPTAPFLNPLPRDYRNGQFKFTSTKAGEKAARDDLRRIVKYGIPGTYMPSFRMLGEKINEQDKGEELNAVVEYVRWLAVRGEFEKRLATELSTDFSTAAVTDTVNKAKAANEEKKKNKEAVDKPLTLSVALKEAASQFEKYQKEDYEAAVTETADFLADGWTRADDPETVVIPSVQRVEDTAESRERGRLLYMSDKTKCYTCHGMTGRGDGNANEDFWPKPGSTTEKYSERGLHDEWGKLLKPRNLTLGQYRGGRRPVDLFRRMYAGIKGTPMPAFGATALKDDEIWDLVNFVMSLPYSSRQPSPASNAGNVAQRDEKPAD